MAGYSGTPLATKLGIKPGHMVVALAAPPEFPAALAPMPDDVQLAAALPRSRDADVIVLFCPNFKAFTAGFEKAARALKANGGLWVSWPKKSSGIPTDISENAIRDYGLAAGLVDNKVCAVTEIWSGLRFVHRVENRAKLQAPPVNNSKTTKAPKASINPSRSASPKTAAGSRPARSASPRARKS